MSNETQKVQYSPFRNWISLIGMVIALGSLFSFILLFVIDTFAPGANPYMGILTFVIAPCFLVGGMFLVIVGSLWQKRRMDKSAGQEAPSLRIDLSRPQDRRHMAVFVLGAFIFIMFAALGSYHTYHFAESVMFCGQTCHTPMGPEYATYRTSPHAQVSCTACHVGPGAVSFVKAKLNGVNQLQATIRNTFDRPIKPPKHMRDAKEICGQCHWPQKYHGNVERTYTRFLSDETNTATTVRMLLKVGGGDSTHGPIGGIHWHMNINSKVEYISTNDSRQSIPWVRLTDINGKVTEYRSSNFKDDPSKYTMRTMDCLDCHNRPAHQYRSPADSVDLSLSVGRIDPAIPLIKSNLVALLSSTNATQSEGLEYIAKSLRTAYAKQPKLESLIAEAQTIYSNSIFPEMKADWRTYPDNIGHKNFPGCFRCHDGQHKTADGKNTIKASNCNDCHVIIAQGGGEAAGKLDPNGLKFAHPDSSSDGTEANCFECHGAQ